MSLERIQLDKLPGLPVQAVWHPKDLAVLCGVSSVHICRLARYRLIPHGHLGSETTPVFHKSNIAELHTPSVRALCGALDAFGKRGSSIEDIRLKSRRTDGARGNIYFVSDGTAVKIGFAINIEERMKALQVGNPRKLQLIAETLGTVHFERALHRHFKRIQMQGEWFRLTKRLRRFIDALPAYNSARAAHIAAMEAFGD